MCRHRPVKETEIVFLDFESKIKEFYWSKDVLTLVIYDFESILRTLEGRQSLYIWSIT